MIDAGEAKIFMSTRDTIIRAYMAGAILALAAVFAMTVSIQTGYAIIGAILFPVGFCMLYLLGFDLLTGVFMLTPLVPFQIGFYNFKKASLGIGDWSFWVTPQVQ